jgi:hypothetical protein
LSRARVSHVLNASSRGCGFGGRASDRTEAERHADQAVARYEKAIAFLWENIDRKKGEMKGRWDGKSMTLPELLHREKQERKDLAKLFHWPDR